MTIVRGLFDEIGHVGEIDPGHYELFDSKNQIAGYLFVDGSVLHVVLYTNYEQPPPKDPINSSPIKHKWVPPNSSGQRTMDVTKAIANAPGGQYRLERYTGVSLSKNP